MAITVTHDNIAIECTKAIKCTNKCYIHCLDAENNIIAAFSKIEDFEAFGISGGDWSNPDVTASGNYSEARGTNSTASGNYSTAQGYNTTASGKYATANGQEVNASGDFSSGSGANTTASGKYSTAQGYNTTASGDYSITSGASTTAEGKYATAIGSSSTASSDYSTAIGQGVKATKNHATAIGQNTTASGNHSTAIGQGSTASEGYATAIGYTTKAQGYYSTAIGNTTTASAHYATVSGNKATASGNYSIAIGLNCNAAGAHSFAQGEGVNASADYQFAIGAYNENLSDAAFEIGRGTSDTDRKNIMRVSNDGTIKANDLVTILEPGTSTYMSFNDLYMSVNPSESGWLTPTLYSGAEIPTSNGIRYRKRNGIVYIEGSIKVTNKTSAALNVFSLPAGYRPNFNLYHINTGSGTMLARWYVTSNGTVGIDWMYSLSNSATITGAIDWVGIAISYPVV